MSAAIIDGHSISKKVRAALCDKVHTYTQQGKRAPSLAVVLVGDDPASHVYVGHKEKACKKVGIASTTIRLAADISQEELNTHLQNLNQNENIDGILLQLPLPRHLNSDIALDQISPEKDVDGLTPTNQGLLACKRPGLFPCTPLGCVELIKSTGIDISGKLTAVVGRSLLVGSPVRTMLTHENATTVAIHTKSVNPKELTKKADILVVAAGVPNFVDASWVKEGAIVIDVGIHRSDSGLTGDVHFDSVKEVASHITPVPRGVGPMTIAMLLQNCVNAWEKKVAS